MSLFSGASTFSYPIEVLSGRGGLQPQLTLSYNSRRVDGVLSWIQSDWAGLGWSIDAIQFVRRVGKSSALEGNRYWNWFSLMLDGASYKLEEDTTSGDPAAYGRYKTRELSALYIVRCLDVLLGIVPGAAGIGHHHRQQEPG